jgi:HD-GYP domain-containing protein (c-di-GMP phosphodiesterase class II)
MADVALRERLQVLLIEDLPYSLYLMRNALEMSRMLERAGHHVTVTPCCIFNAIEILKQYRFDLIITGQVSPDIIAGLNRILKDEGIDTPIWMVPGWAKDLWLQPKDTRLIITGHVLPNIIPLLQMILRDEGIDTPIVMVPGCALDPFFDRAAEPGEPPRADATTFALVCPTCKSKIYVQALGRIYRCPLCGRDVLAAWFALDEPITTVTTSAEPIPASIRDWPAQPLNFLFMRGTPQRETESLDLTGFLSMTRAIQLRDPMTGVHCGRVAVYAVACAKELGLQPEDARLIHIGSWLHDLGKIHIPDHILRKPGKLTPAEFEIMKAHTTTGAEHLEAAIRNWKISWLSHHGSPGIPVLARVIPIIRSHHERWDGGGYPDGLKGEQIPLYARIVAVAEAFDVMTMDQPYRRAMPLESARAELQRESGGQFDPACATAFMAGYARN